jgi:hypothetical protein
MLLYFGASTRYIFHRFMKRRPKESFHSILHGIEVKCKEDEIKSFDNEFVNRLYGIGGTVIIVT